MASSRGKSTRRPERRALVVRREEHPSSDEKSTRRPDDERPFRTTGFVSLVGAGTGDPELLTVRAARRLADADLVLYDGLVTSEVLELAAAADRVCVSRRPGVKTLDQASVTK